jgi:uncharacterized protein
MIRPTLSASLVVLAVVGCDRGQPLAPVMEAASSGLSGPTVKAPSNVNAIGLSAERIDVSWRDNSTNEDGFEISRSPTGLEGSFTLVAVLAENVVTHSDQASGIDPWTPYCYRVRAFRTVSHRTGFSEFNSGCAPAGDIRVRAVTTGVDLDADGYAVMVEAVTQLRSLSLISATMQANGTVSFPRLRAGTTYRVYLGDVDPNCGLNSPNPQAPAVVGGTTAEALFELTCTALTPPGAPSFLSASPYPGAIWLWWSDGSDNEDGFKVERCDSATCGDADFNVIATRTEPWYFDQPVSEGTTYTYRIRAFNRAGASAPSSEVIVMACVIGISDDGTYVCS